MLTLYPAIDLRGGRCVRLLRGEVDAETVYYEDPLVPARLWREAGARWIHVVDLDGAFTGQPAHTETVADLAALGIPLQVGGGLRSEAAVATVLEAGARRAVLGTSALEDFSLLERALARFGPDRIAVGLDAREGRLATRGWVETTETTTLEMAHRLEEAGVRTVIHTDIATDGTLAGPNLERQAELASATSLHLIASGGVGQPADLEALDQLATEQPGLEGVIVGRALYEGTIRLADWTRTPGG